MTYEIKRRETRWGPVPWFDVFVDGEKVGEIVPQFRTYMNSARPHAYLTEIRLEGDAMTDETGFPWKYRTQKDAFAATKEFMSRNGHATA